MKRYFAILAILFSSALVIAATIPSGSGKSNPRDLLNQYFSSAVKQDYGSAYDCYYAAYRTKVSKDEYIRHRKEASTLLAYRIESITEKEDSAEARVDLTFAPSEKLKRTQPVTKPVVENMVRENGAWKIKVWERN